MTAQHLYDCDPYAEEGMPVPEPDRRPLNLALVAVLVLEVNCGECWAHPGEPCGCPGGMHLARFARARRRGAIADVDMAVVLEAAPDVFTPATVIPCVLAGAAA